jgi:hypothetical protein
MGKLVLALLAATAALGATGDAGAVPAHRQAQARGVADPRAFVEQIYAAYVRGHGDSTPPEPAYAYSDRLRALFRAYHAHEARNRGELVGALDFDWWINAQDWSLSHVVVTQAEAGPATRAILARFRNGDRQDATRFLFVRVGNRWYLDDAVNGTGRGDDGWTLSALLGQRD